LLGLPQLQENEAQITTVKMRKAFRFNLASDIFMCSKRLPPNSFNLLLEHSRSAILFVNSHRREI